MNHRILQSVEINSPAADCGWERKLAGIRNRYDHGLCCLLAAPAAIVAPGAIVLETNLEKVAFPGFAIESGNGGAGFMPFHLKKSEALAGAGKQVLGKFNGMNATVL